MIIDFLDEPELEFGTGRHIDIRFGLMNLGPLDVNQLSSPKIIRAGIVGTPETVEGSAAWLERCRSEIPAKLSPRHHLFPRWPGFNRDAAFRSQLSVDSRNQREISDRKLMSVVAAGRDETGLEDAVTLFLEEITYLVENSTVDVIICAPPDVLDRGALPDIQGTRQEIAPNHRGRRQGVPTFHDLLKARAMSLRKPLQLLFPATYEGRGSRGRHRDRALQDEATRAWNFHTAVYYKAGGRPWRLMREPSDFATCYVGVSFYESPDQSALLTSMAQVFNERGHGVIVRGAPASISKDDRRPHLTTQDAYDLLSAALAQYRGEHHTLPARAVMHKTSTYTREELTGFIGAAEQHDIHSIDLVSVASSATRLFRAGAYPPLRGTLWLTEEGPHFLYTRGSVEFYSAYPGLYVPRPLQYRIEYGDCTSRSAGVELLELTKMNWNSTQFDNAEPISVRAARQVGSILKHVGEGDPIEHRYGYYM